MDLSKIFGRKKENSQAPAGGGMIPEIATPPVAARNDESKVIDLAAIREAYQELQRYKEGKKNLEERVIANEQWYKLRHWDYIRGKEQRVTEPASGWLFNSIATKHADMMDNYPMANILPREAGDKEEAEKLTAIIPVVMEQADFEQVYSDSCDAKLRGGTGVVGVFWNQQKLNGLGDIDIREMDILNLFWEPGVTDIQQSRYFFSLELQDNEYLELKYPQLKGKLSGETATVSKYIYDDTVTTNGKSLVVDWYYKKLQGGRTVLHYCKFAGDTVLYASENDEKYRDRGWYDHGLYPFVFDPMFRVKGSPCGFGYIDLAKSAQEYIDKSNQAMLQSLLVNARPRYFIRSDGAVNEKEFADLSKDFIHVDGNLGQDSVMPVQGKDLQGNYITLVQNKIDELKEITGNRDISNGGTTSGVTAASAIAAMQEAGSKLSRDANKASFRVYRKVVYMVIELIRQFYDLQRCFRIQGAKGQEEFVNFSNAGIKAQSQGTGMGLEETFRLPMFDIEVAVQKQSAYSKLSQNELAIQFYNSGFFDPARAEQALACLEFMDFDRKQFVIDKINKSQTLMGMLQQSQQRCMQLAEMVDMLSGKTNLAGALAVEGGGMAAGAAGPVQMSEAGAQALGAEAGEAENTRKARQRVAESTSPG
ncbi:MAG: hypothetical protein IKA47_12435 [Oscillospiraceae bacterium]|nr:hypothetical protein [Oscillospiraceae bacterium]